MRLAALVAMLAFFLAAPASAAKGDVRPLFADEAPLSVTIDGPVRDIALRADHSTDPQPATLAVNGETHAIQLSARGLSRRQKVACAFPPLMVRFDDKPDKASLFAKQGRLKLVTHCREDANFERYVLREYAIYRLYNILTPNSLKVRLARVRYLNRGKPMTEHWGFFIEDIDNAARRMGGKELNVPDIRLAALDPAIAAHYVLFQYMIGNLDWDMLTGAKGTLCCHNSKLVGADKTATEGLIPVPYDFDYAGVVDTPYASVPPTIPITSVRTRFYRGFCKQHDAVLAAAPDMLAARPAFEAGLKAIEQLPDSDRSAMLRYLSGFFDDIATSDLVERKLFKTCR